MPCCHHLSTSGMVQPSPLARLGQRPSSSSRSRSWCSQRRHPPSAAAAATEQHGSHSTSNWVPPGTWCSGVAAALPSVDVDSLSAYTHLLQEVLVMTPSLLGQPAEKAAASLAVLERFTRSSAVWFGPAACSELLQAHTPASLATSLEQLMQVWLELGQTPHSFGLLWLEAPQALLAFASQPAAFSSHLQRLEAALDNGPISQQLAASSSLAGFLLSCQRPDQALAGALQRGGGWLVIAPGASDLQLLLEEQQDQGSGPGSAAAVLSVYGTYQPASGSGHGSSDDANGLLAAQLPSAGGVYGWQAAVNSAQSSHAAAAPAAPADTISGAGVTSQAWQQPLDGSSISSSAGFGHRGERQLLMQLDVLPNSGRAGPLMPVLLLPPHLQQQQQQQQQWTRY